MRGPGTTVEAAYAAPAFGLALVGIPVYMHIPKFYTDVVGVEIAAVGAAILGVRAFDALTDPLIGVVSDRTRTRWGRRRPYILGASVPLAVCVWLLFNPPALDPASGAVWFTVSMLALFVAWTLVTVPYESLGPELTFDYHARTRLLGTRDAILLLGTFAGVVSPALAGALVPDPDDTRAVFSWISVFYAPLLVALCVWCVAATHEVARPATLREPTGLKGLGDVRSNRPFRILLASYSVGALGNNLPPALILFYVQYVLGSERAPLFLALYMGTGIACLPLWIRAARLLDKKRAWLWGMAINTGAFACVLALDRGDELAYGVLVVLSGIGMGATLAVPSSMQADVIDYDELRSGQRREGLFLGVWAFARKLAAALGVGVALQVLAGLGYAPSVEQSPGVILGLKLLYAGVPCVCNALAFAIALAYPIDRALHASIRGAIDAGRAGDPSADPLAWSRA